MSDKSEGGESRQLTHVSDRTCTNVEQKRCRASQKEPSKSGSSTDFVKPGIESLGTRTFRSGTGHLQQSIDINEVVGSERGG